MGDNLFIALLIAVMIAVIAGSIATKGIANLAVHNSNQCGAC